MYEFIHGFVFVVIATAASMWSNKIKVHVFKCFFVIIAAAGIFFLVDVVKNVKLIESPACVYVHM